MTKCLFSGPTVTGVKVSAERVLTPKSRVRQFHLGTCQFSVFTCLYSDDRESQITILKREKFFLSWSKVWRMSSFVNSRYRKKATIHNKIISALNILIKREVIWVHKLLVYFYLV